MRKFLKNIYILMASPFNKDLTFLMILSLLVCGPWFCYRTFINYNGIRDIVWECVHCYLLCYFICVILYIVPSKFSKIYKVVFYTFAFIDFCVETACLLVTRAPFSGEHVQIVMGTNTSEITEFVRTYFSLSFICYIMVGLCLIITICVLEKHLKYIASKVQKLLTIATIISVLFFTIIKGSDSFYGKFYLKIIEFTSYTPSPDLREYVKYQEISIDKELPSNIVVIIGESFSKYHSSLYGYEKDTSPRLLSMSNDSSIIVYENVVAPALHTIPCIKSIMSTWDVSKGNSVDWYKCETLISLMKSLDYKTVWVSNQSPTGLHDNIAAAYANLCDEVYWVGSKYKGVYKNDYDGELLSFILNNNIIGDNCFVVVHLMGSHVAYRDRYPPSWSFFEEADYAFIPKHQRKILCEYDNSILYNDYVVSELLESLGTRDCIALYFSDHGLDMYKSSDEYFGYGITSDSVSVVAAKAIPFLVYMSPSITNRFPTMRDLIISKRNDSLNTSSLMDFLSELLNY